MAKIDPKTYGYISQKITAIKEQYPSLRDKEDDYVFNALVVKSTFYKNPYYELTEKDLEDMIVDGRADGGADVLLHDPSSEAPDLIIGQAKFHQSIDFDECNDTVNKMADFYLNMTNGHYEYVSEKVQKRYLTLEGDLGDESKVLFVLYISAPQNGIRIDRLKTTFYTKLSDHSKYELRVLFDKDIIDEINEAESRKPSVEFGKIRIDKEDNWISYNDMAVMVNISAFSIKKLYAQHHTNLLARNLRYHVSGASVDRAIEDSINNSPELFWLKNNGITIICDDYEFEGKELKLTNFSVINGGQTTYKISKNKQISEKYDLYLPCKIVKVIGDTENERDEFCLEIAKATNSQKPIKPSDLKANAPEQRRFSIAMRNEGIFYQTKRGEEVPKTHKAKYLHSDISEIGKLCLSGVFQMPCTSRNKPSKIYEDEYYEPIFIDEQPLIAKLSKELLYIDNYYRTSFISKFAKENEGKPNSDVKIQFANNARTVCIAFVVFASRYHQKNIDSNYLKVFFKAAQNDKLTETEVLSVIKNLNGVSWILPPEIIADKDKYNKTLDSLFKLIIKHGSHDLMIQMEKDENATATNFLKKDKSYVDILRLNWDDISEKLEEIFADF